MINQIFSGIFFKLEDLRLRLHFSYVRQHLLTVHPDSILSCKEQNNRLNLIHRLKQYSQNSAFPRNISASLPQPYFYGNQHRICAVADLLIHTGHIKLADQIALRNNNARVTDMHFSQLNDWAKKMGVSQKDLILIQPQYYSPAPESLPILLLSCANLFWLVCYGHRHIKYTLAGLLITLLLTGILFYS